MLMRGRTVLGDGADDIAFGEHAGRGIAFGPDDVLDHKRADIARAHQLGRNGHGFIHSNCCNTRGLFAQDVSDFHRNLLLVSRRDKSSHRSRLVYIMPIVNLISERNLEPSMKESGSNIDVSAIWIGSGGRLREA